MHSAPDLLSVGYGDIVIKTSFGRLVTVLIGFIGSFFTDLMIAVLVHAVPKSIQDWQNSD